MQLLDNRYRDYVGFPPLLRSGENDGKSFSDFYRASQIELLSALDNVLSQKAEDTLNQFAAVKKAEVNFQTSLGNRKGQLGINLIGAFAERHNNAFGWQVRVYGAQQDGKGFNAGVFYRRLSGDILFGANAFVDYENHKLGNFYRYSIGGEAQNRYGSFAANYYIPLTDEKRKDGGVIFSRKGYDAKLRLNIPNAKFLKAAVDYYNFGDEHGAKSDDGFRYGAEAHLIPGLRLGLFYDDGGEELGGEVSYIHTIGEVQQAQTTNEQWTPDLFAAVSREHSQRIVSVSVQAIAEPQIRTSVMITTLIMITPQTLRVANVFFSITVGVGTSQEQLILTRPKIEMTLPPATASRPYILTIMRDLNSEFRGRNDSNSPVIISSYAQVLVGTGYRFNQAGTGPFTIAITEGSEDFTGRMVVISLTSTSTSTSTITLGATSYDNSIPPGFMPQSPQLPKIAFAAIPHISPSFPRPQLSFPRRRESTRRRAANADGAKRHLTRRGFYIPVILA